MIRDQEWNDKLDLLEDLAMGYEVGVIPFFEKNYLQEFYDFYEIRHRSGRLIPAEAGFEESLRDVSGEYRWEAIAEKALELFGRPFRVMVFDTYDPGLTEELGGTRGLSPFFFVFDMIFCEYEGFTLCFMSGSNN